MGCGRWGKPIQGEEIEREPAPGAAVVAITTKANYGATVPYVFRVYLQQTHSPDDADELLRADNVIGLQIEWEASGALLIRMRCGRIFAYRNFSDIIEDGELVARIPVRLEAAVLCDEPLANELDGTANRTR